MTGAIRGIMSQSEISKDQAMVKSIVTRYLSFSPPRSGAEQFHPEWFTRTHDMFFMREDDRIPVEA